MSLLGTEESHDFPDFCKAVRASSLLSFRAEPVRLAPLARGELRGVEESLDVSDLRWPIRASSVLSFRADRSEVEESLDTPDFPNAIRA